LDGSVYCSSYFSLCVVEIKDPDTGAKFKVNRQRLKKFLEFSSPEDVEYLILCEPSYEDWWFLCWYSLGIISTRPRLIDPSFSLFSFVLSLLFFFSVFWFWFSFCLYVFLFVIFLDKILLVLSKFHFLFISFHQWGHLCDLGIGVGSLKIEKIEKIWISFHLLSLKKKKRFLFCFGECMCYSNWLRTLITLSC